MEFKYPADKIKAKLTQSLLEIIEEVSKFNLQIGIEQVNLQPLAMGNYRFEPKVVDAWHKKYLSLDELDTLVSSLLTLKRKPVFHEYSENEVSISEPVDNKFYIIGLMKTETYDEYCLQVEKNIQESKQNEHIDNSAKSD